MKKKIQLYATGVIIIAIFIGWAVFFHYYPVENIVSNIGIQNTYLAAFIFAVVGGFSSITGTSLYAALIALSQAGVNPLILGLVGGLGLFLSDSIFYFVASKMRSVILHVTSKWERLFRKIWKWIYTLPKWVVYSGIFIYCAFGPLPNDILLAVLALSGYSYRQFAIFLFAGDITMALLLTNISNSVA